MRVLSCLGLGVGLVGVLLSGVFLVYAMETASWEGVEGYLIGPPGGRGESIGYVYEVNGVEYVSQNWVYALRGFSDPVRHRADMGALEGKDNGLQVRVYHHPYNPRRVVFERGAVWGHLLPAIGFIVLVGFSSVFYQLGCGRVR